MWSIIGTAVQGRGHAKKNIPVQDKIYYKRGEVTVMALADGAGSASLSHYGAERVTETICALLYDCFDDIFEMNEVEEAQHMVMDTVLNELHQLAESHQEPVKAFASTLLAVAVKGNNVLILHLGDGEIGTIKHGKRMNLSSAENGEYANATIFTTSQHAWRHLRLFKSRDVSSFSSFFLMSDGTAASLYSKERNYFSPFISKLAEQSSIHKEQVLNGLLEESFENLVKQKTQDDCALVMMTMVNESPSYAKLTRSDKELLVHYLNNPKHCSIKKWDKMTELLQQPLTLKQLAKAMLVKRSYVKANVNALMKAGMITYQKGKYYLN
ncbi:PP2C family serine/threonine-protein phosphatase [Bacillus niameyensis]|uniref:PP2C family serine/threonine-protein phosphatase n=1 Tax=Bacillus niameyensis TaxID=1522308 RepID=UPI000AC78BC5|nr:PP2C family serine/threonine-protein phosphatase [Bacillus niameyensis]